MKGLTEAGSTALLRKVEQQTGCLGRVPALLLGIRAFLVLAPASGSVDATPAPMLVATPAPSRPAP